MYLQMTLSPTQLDLRKPLDEHSLQVESDDGIERKAYKTLI